MKIKSIGIIGYGTVGKAMHRFYSKNNIPIYIYDKYVKPYTDKLKNLLKTNIVFISIPSNYCPDTLNYDINKFQNILDYLDIYNYKGAVIIKSTLLPGTSEYFSNQFPGLNIIYNPEFLSEKTAIYDYAHPKQIILGTTPNLNHIVRDSVGLFFYKLFPDKTPIEVVDSREAEATKLYLNSFYAVKVQFFNELHFLSNNMDIDYKNVVNLMLNQGWINPQHTRVPGHDGKFSYGGKCLPKDANALLGLMKYQNSNYSILESTVEENKIFRPENYTEKFDI